MPLRDTTRCPVTVNYSIQFSQEDSVGLCIVSLYYFTSRWVIPRVGNLAMAPCKRVGKKYFCRASSTGWNAYTIYGLTHWMKYHY